MGCPFRRLTPPASGPVLALVGAWIVERFAPTLERPWAAIPSHATAVPVRSRCAASVPFSLMWRACSAAFAQPHRVGCARPRAERPRASAHAVV
eukprot:scaffold965_cov120-Isochrysis_galbana.AAC.9